MRKSGSRCLESNNDREEEDDEIYIFLVSRKLYYLSLLFRVDVTDGNRETFELSTKIYNEI